MASGIRLAAENLVIGAANWTHGRRKGARCLLTQLNADDPDEQLLLRRATDLSAAIKDGSVSCVQLVEATLARANFVQRKVNAVCEFAHESARQTAAQLDELAARARLYERSARIEQIDSSKQGSREDCDRTKQIEHYARSEHSARSEQSSRSELDERTCELNEEERTMLASPLFGIPVSIKESVAVSGMRQTCGLWTRRDVRASKDAATVQALRDAGMIPFATTNVPECTLYWADCANTIYGRTLNPYDTTRVPGGSSGGEAALLAGAGSLIGLGSDVGGSLRFPAHFCGINSHKPSPLLLSADGNFPEIKPHRMQLFSVGPMTRYASDLRPMLTCLLKAEQLRQDELAKLNKATETDDLVSDERRALIVKLNEPINLSKLILYYCDFRLDTPYRKLRDIRVDDAIMNAQDEAVAALVSKFNCKLVEVNLDKFLKYSIVCWHAMMGAKLAENTDDNDENNVGKSLSEKSDLADNQQDAHALRQRKRRNSNVEFEKKELNKSFGITSLPLEFAKLAAGKSTHTLEAVLVSSHLAVKKKDNVVQVFDKMQSVIGDLQREFDAMLGETGVLIMPTAPSVAYKHKEALFRSSATRFTIFLNVVHATVTHATFGRATHKQLPFGFSFAAKKYNDRLTLEFAEQFELLFGGWRQPIASRKKK